jgi:hypothetical protein
MSKRHGDIRIEDQPGHVEHITLSLRFLQLSLSMILSNRTNVSCSDFKRKASLADSEGYLAYFGRLIVSKPCDIFLRGEFTFGQVPHSVHRCVKKTKQILL